MTKTVLCDRSDCFANKNGICHALEERLNTKECPFYKTAAQIKLQEEKLYGFYEERDWEKTR